MTDEEKQPWLDVPIAGLISRGTLIGWLVALSLVVLVAILIANHGSQLAEAFIVFAIFAFFLAIRDLTMEVRQNLQSRKRNQQHEEKNNEE